MPNQRPAAPGSGSVAAASPPAATDEAFAQTVAPAAVQRAAIGSSPTASIESDATINLPGSLPRDGSNAATGRPANQGAAPSPALPTLQ
ncbi:MAG TPA: hypothetical protein PLF40_23155, partial [Kofleriaceae bacterium]|nr:hypothetical protein [Kofleriaceae bacterium]